MHIYIESNPFLAKFSFVNFSFSHKNRCYNTNTHTKRQPMNCNIHLRYCDIKCESVCNHYRKLASIRQSCSDKRKESKQLFWTGTNRKRPISQITHTVLYKPAVMRVKILTYTERKRSRKS